MAEKKITTKKAAKPEEKKPIPLVEFLRRALFNKKNADTHFGKSPHQGSHKRLANENMALKKERRKAERQNRRKGRA